MFSRRLLAAAALMGALALVGCSKGSGGAASSEDMSLGDPKAKVQVTEYASASCAHCARFNNEVFPAFKAKYIDTGKVHYTLKEFLTPPENVAAAGFLLARCAGKDKYFTVLDSIYKNQSEMFQTGDFRGVLLRIAQSSGMTEAQFSACIQDDAAQKALAARVEKHIKEDKVDSTPTFDVNGVRLKSGEISMPELDAAYDKAAK
jgi:protein-disulfide isomerase